MVFKLKERKTPRIEITPLIDVVFLLLLFFMVTTHFSSVPGLQITLPEIEPSSPITTTSRIEITINSGGDIFLAGNPVPETNLKETFQQLVPDPAAIVVILNADKNVSHGKVVAVMDILRQLKINKMVITARWDDTL